MDKVLQQVRTQGYAIANQQMEIGLRSIAVPVRDKAGTVVSGINIIGPTSRMARWTIRKVAPHRQVTPMRASSWIDSDRGEGLRDDEWCNIMHRS